MLEGSIIVSQTLRRRANYIKTITRINVSKKSTPGHPVKLLAMQHAFYSSISRSVPCFSLQTKCILIISFMLAGASPYPWNPPSLKPFSQRPYNSSSMTRRHSSAAGTIRASFMAIGSSVSVSISPVSPIMKNTPLVLIFEKGSSPEAMLSEL